MKHDPSSKQIVLPVASTLRRKSNAAFFVQFVARAVLGAFIMPGRNMKTTSRKESGRRLRRPRFVSGNAKHLPGQYVRIVLNPNSPIVVSPFAQAETLRSREPCSTA